MLRAKFSGLLNFKTGKIRIFQALETRQLIGFRKIPESRFEAFKEAAIFNDV